MGWLVVNKFIALGARRKGRAQHGFRNFMPSFRQWGWMKCRLDDLLKKQSIVLSDGKAKELQQYAEEIIYLAKKQTQYHDRQAESMLMTQEARQILWEKLLPRYKDRPFFTTRIVKLHEKSYMHTAPKSRLEFVDRPGETRPANPVGEARKEMVKNMFEYGSRRDRRRYLSEAIRLGISEAPEGHKYHGMKLPLPESPWWREINNFHFRNSVDPHDDASTHKIK